MTTPQTDLFGNLNNLISSRYGQVLYNKHDMYIGKSIEQYGEYSYGESQFFEVFARPGYTVLDVGANIGFHTLCFARSVGPSGKVYAFEPQRIIFQTLCANMALNSFTNVYCSHAAVGKKSGSVVVPLLDYGQKNNFGGLGLEEKYQQGESVPLITIDSLNLSSCHCIKIDVEGMEIGVLEGARQTLKKHHPILYVENDRREKSPALLDFLMASNYRIYWHLPFLFNPENYFGNPNNIFSSIRSINIIGVPEIYTMEMPGLKEIKSIDDWYK